MNDCGNHLFLVLMWTSVCCCDSGDSRPSGKSRFSFAKSGSSYSAWPYESKQTSELRIAFEHNAIYTRLSVNIL
jgi:hypothetical protein